MRIFFNCSELSKFNNSLMNSMTFSDNVIFQLYNAKRCKLYSQVLETIGVSDPAERTWKLNAVGDTEEM